MRKLILLGLFLSSLGFSGCDSGRDPHYVPSDAELIQAGNIEAAAQAAKQLDYLQEMQRSWPTPPALPQH